jgi:hypothetical protein
MANHFELIEQKTGQLTQIGTENGAPVYMIRVDREDFVNEQGESKYRQPDSAALLGIMDQILSAQGQTEQSLGLITSNTYASRALDVVRAGLSSGRNYFVGMYGRQTLATIKGEEVSAPTAINQIPGELHVIAGKLMQLTEEYLRSIEQAQE